MKPSPPSPTMPPPPTRPAPDTELVSYHGNRHSPLSPSSAAPAQIPPHLKPPSPPPPTMPPSLPDDLLEEIFLRLPPVEPACLVHASLTSKLWLGRLSSPCFRGRYREFHGPPPILGFFYSGRHKPVLPFVPTTKFGSPIPGEHRVDWDYAACDCRHGRLLLGSLFEQPNRLDVWDPMTGCRRELYAPEEYLNYGYGAVVLCAVAGCDHRACHAGPFRVVFVGLVINDDGERVAHARVSLPETGDCRKPCSDSHFDEWSEPCSGLHLPGQTFIEPMPPVLVEGAPHFRLAYDDDDHGVGILKYDLSSNCLSLIDVPLAVSVNASAATILVAMEDGSLGFAHVDKLTLHTWSRQLGSNGLASWTQRTTIDLNNQPPIQNPIRRLELIGSVEGTDIIFVTAGLDIYEISLKTLRWKQLEKREKTRALIPYMSFFNQPERVSPLRWHIENAYG